MHTVVRPRRPAGAARTVRLLVDGGQGEYVRVPLRRRHPRRDPRGPTTRLVPALLALSDVMGTGHHAAVSAGVGPGQTVVVVGDGAVGLCAVLAAKRLGAERIIAMSRHADRQAVAREFGATDIVAERGDEGVAAVEELPGGDRCRRALECVGTEESMHQALDSVRPGGEVGYVGVPTGGPELPIGQLFDANIALARRGGPGPGLHPRAARRRAGGRDRPRPVFDLELPLDERRRGYRAMDERRAIKVLLTP